MKRWALRTGKMVAGTLVLVLMVSGQASADLVANGSFETGDFSGWVQSGDPSYTYVARSGTTGYFGSQGYTSESGSYLALLGPISQHNPGVLYQNLATTAGKSYTFSFYVASNGDNPDEFKASWNGNQILDLKNIPSTGTGYNGYSFTETATLPTTTIQFSFYDTQSYLALDNVSVVANALSAPEPSTAIVGLVGGLAMTGYVWRTRRRRTKA